MAFLGLAELDLSPPAERSARAALSFDRFVIPCENNKRLVSACQTVWVVVVMRRGLGTSPWSWIGVGLGRLVEVG